MRIDCDIHPGLEGTRTTLLPYLDDHWKEQVTSRAIDGLDLTSYAGVMKGTKFGPMVIPGDPESSNLMLLLDWRASPELRMPHGKKQLSSCDRNAIRSWIREGAKDN